MIHVKPGQVWEIGGRRGEVRNVLLDRVEPR